MSGDRRLSRRNFICGQIKPAAQKVRPPWTSETRIQEECERCGHCAERCPQGIIALDEAGLPWVNFDAGECTFCAACAEICPADVFTQTTDRPWTLQLSLAPGCLAAAGVFCRSCGDACPERAIRFEVKLGGVAALRIDEDACTGCGACISVCPRNVLSLKPASKQEAAAHG